MDDSLKIGNSEFDLKNKIYIMGILNLTPDSFSDGGDFYNVEHALKRAEKMKADGADIIDIGGESTRPNYKPVSQEEELERVIKIVERIKREIDIPISIDTYKGIVAEEAIKAGANLINDVWGFKKDSNMVKVVKKYNVPCCLMHNRLENNYKNLLDDCLNDLRESIDIALEGGISKDNIIIDPGIGFAKNFDENIEVFKNLELFSTLGFPVLLGASRKRFIGTILNQENPKDRVEGTVATSIIGAMKGCSIIRVHDVLENKRAVMVCEAIIKN